jgi:two-component system, cell cycle sensor histidine kinase and response regulator CckA
MALLTRHGRQVVVDSRWSLVRNSQGEPHSLLIVNSDVTAKKQLESQYLRAQRLESLGILASGVAHDLNNVLSPLLMGGSVLEFALEDKDSRSVLAAMMDAVRRGSDTVKQLLTFARGGEGQRAIVQPRHLLQEISRLLQQTLPKNIQLCTDFSPNLNSLMADPSQLHQVLMNLGVNARDAMPNGGILSITIENALLDDRAKRLHPKAVQGSYVIFSVTDTGAGIAPELMDKIFVPFFTTNPPGQGTGLGLATVIGIVENHGGFILVDSQLGKGTTFSIYLPAMPSGHRADKVSRHLTTLKGHDELILVVDDELGIRRLFHDVLKRHGYQSLMAGSAPEALELFRTHREKIRVVLTDLMMPFMDGRDLIQQLRALSSSVKIVAFSGLATDSKRDEVMAAGANAFLSKPVEAEELLTVLKDLLNSEKQQD